MPPSGVPRMPPVITSVVISGLLAHLLQPTESCLETAWTAGLLEQGTAIDSVTLAYNRGSACVCCAHCNANSNCASLSYNGHTKECLLFDVVANYSAIVANAQWKYFVMPERSHHQQFCRQNKDCLDTGDLCRGRICTNLDAITCRVIYETFGAGDRLGEYVQMHGWLKDGPILLRCRMRSDWPGFTRVFRNQRHSTHITRNNIDSYNGDISSVRAVHSSLALAEVIRKLRDDETYELRTIAKCDDKAAYSDAYLIQAANVTRNQSVVERTLTEAAVRDTPQEAFQAIPALSTPYVLYRDEDIINVNVNVDMADGTQRQISLPLARTDGYLWFQSVSLYIRE